MQQFPDISRQVAVACVTAVLTAYAVGVVQDERNRVPHDLQRRVDEIDRRCTEALARRDPRTQQFEEPQRGSVSGTPRQSPCRDAARSLCRTVVDGCEGEPAVSE